MYLEPNDGGRDLVKWHWKWGFDGNINWLIKVRPNICKIPIYFVHNTMLQIALYHDVEAWWKIRVGFLFGLKCLYTSTEIYIIDFKIISQTLVPRFIVCVSIHVFVHFVSKFNLHISCEFLYVPKMIASYNTGLMLGLRPANERRCYFVTTSLIGWVQT